jgi:hypothetical protein
MSIKLLLLYFPNFSVAGLVNLFCVCCTHLCTYLHIAILCAYYVLFASLTRERGMEGERQGGRNGGREGGAAWVLSTGRELA